MFWRSEICRNPVDFRKDLRPERTSGEKLTSSRLGSSVKSPLCPTLFGKIDLHEAERRERYGIGLDIDDWETKDLVRLAQGAWNREQ